MLKEYMAKLPFLQTVQNKSRKREQQAERPAPPPAEEPLWPEGDPFAEDELEDVSATKIMNLDELQFGPNYKKD